MAYAIFHDNQTFSGNLLPCNNYLLYQVGEMYCKKDTLIHPHTQVCCEITFGVDGVGECGSETLEKIGKNDCFFSLSNEHHQISTDKKDPLRFHFIGFHPRPNTLGEQYVAAIQKCLADRETRIINLPVIHNYIDELINEAKHISLLSLDLIDNLLSRILIEIIRAYSPVESPALSPEITSESMLVYSIMDYLDTHAWHMKALKELEQEFNYSYNYMSSLFHTTMPFSLHDYFRKLKMEAAKKMLEAGDKTVTQISDALEFSSVHTFSRSFKQYYGVSPRQCK